MATYTLKDLITEYGLPLDVKKPRWYGDYFFRAEDIKRDGSVSGTIFLNGEEHETKRFSGKEEMVLCYAPDETDESDVEEAHDQLPNPNGLDTDMSHYIKGVTKLFVNIKGVAKPAIFDHFSEVDGQVRIYVIKEGETKAGFYLFPQTKYVFPNKDEAQIQFDKEARHFGISPSRTIVSAFSTKPKSRVPSKKTTEEHEYERSYHTQVDGQLVSELAVPEKKKKEAQYDLAHADEELRDEIVAARENGYMVDDHTYISHRLRKETADSRISSAQREIGRLEGIRRKPYFARIDCGASMRDLHTVYLGDDDIDGLVVSWRHPEYGNAYYQSGILQGRDDLVLALKRIISINRGEFDGYEDEISLYTAGKTTNPGTEVTYEGKADELLTRLLIESRADKRAHDIIKTIQGEQYEIITSDFRKNAVINGCAGSGKTMIMYHRLSYMAYNYQSYLGKQFNPKNVYIISPSSFFDSSNDELLTKLSIDSVHQSPFYEQIDNLLDIYCCKEGIVPFYGLARYLETRGSSPVDFFTTNEFLRFESNVRTVVEETRSFRQWTISLANYFLALHGFNEISLDILPKTVGEVHSLFTTSDYLYNDCFSKKGGTADDRDSRRLYSPQAITNISLENVFASLNQKHDKSSALFKQRLKKITKNIDLLRCCLSLKTKTDVSSNVSTDIGEFWTLLGNSAAFEKMLAVLVAEKLIECIVPTKKDSTSYILRCLWVFRDMYSSQQADYVKLFILHSLSAKYGPAISEDALIFIDEFQNYSSFEIRCLKYAFGSPVFNLFGDYDQRIEEKGSDLKANLTELLSPNAYNININYRNAKQITEYINRTVHKNMQSIGVHGTVIESTLDRCEFKIADRTAIICRDPKLALFFLKRYIDAALINNSSVSKELVPEKYTLMTVLDCKGLEFDTVYVLDYGMTDNEKYVAYTRALDTLVVIPDDLEAIKLAEEEAERKRKEEERLRAKQAQELKKKQKHISGLITVLKLLIEKKASEEASVSTQQARKEAYRHKYGSQLIDVISQVVEKKEDAGKSTVDMPAPDGTASSEITDPKKACPNPFEEAPMTVQELRLQEELRKLEEYRSALERKEEETRQAEAARKEKLYSLALTKSETDDILQLTEAIVLLETIIDHKNAVELIAKIRIKISQISSRAEEQKASYRRNNLCQHCGGKFKGLFSKQCRVCGKKKDY